MNLVREKGYMATTTKDIARSAKVNECTLFRKFESKKDIILHGIDQQKWRADVTSDIFKNVVWDLRKDLEMYMRVYMDRVTADVVNLSIGLRAPQLYDEAAPLIMKVPQAFVSSLTGYLEEMGKRGKIAEGNYEYWAMTVFSATFGYTFLKASFNDDLDKTTKEEYIKKSVSIFIEGIPGK